MKFTCALFVVGALAVQVEHQQCSRAVSMKSDVHNDHCMALCEELIAAGKTPMAETTFSQGCALAHYTTKNGRVVPDHSCFDTSVYGYSEGTTFDSLVPNLYYATPAMCQLACQENADCAQWSWASELSNQRQRCLLKSHAMVTGALAQDTSDAGNLVNGSVCAVTTPAACASHLYDCLQCAGVSRCVWTSHLHVSGWKNCAAVVDKCVGEVPLPTEPVSPPKFSVCDEYVSVNPTLTNDYCMESCNSLMATGGDAALESDQDFVQTCAHEHYTTGQGEAQPSGACFDNLIFGYSQETALASVPDVQGLYVDTPAQCQLHCQQHPDCESFVFVTELIASTGSKDVHKCLIKSHKMVEEALHTNVAQEGVIVPPSYCNVNIPYMCSTGAYSCLSCSEGATACAWNSKLHIAGQKHCGALKKACELA